MYDEYARQLIESIPELPDLDRAACRRALSNAYFFIVKNRLGIANDEFDERDLQATRDLLRRMVDALESIAVFDRLNGQKRAENVESACAFVAAEALSLLSSWPREKIEAHTISDPLFRFEVYTAVESALLYMIGGYDINASSTVRDLAIPEVGKIETISDFRTANSAYVLSRTVAFCQGKVSQARQAFPLVRFGADMPDDYDLVLDDIRVRLYERIGLSLEVYLDWLGGYEGASLETVNKTLEDVRNATLASGNSGYTAFADVYHFCSLLLAAIGCTSQRTVVHNVPSPQSGGDQHLREFSDYLRYRARGNENLKARPFLWPSVFEYVNSCLPGPSQDAIVAMPTGSGKSFVAELAIAHALSSGWVLYLAPTNALAHQIRRDLEHALKPFVHVEIRAFVGHEEYTILFEEEIVFAERRFVAVMTPEKCALALRLSPQAFASCSLCVFDECHLLNDWQRGITADVLLAQMFLQAPKARFVLMSAMVANPEDLADWLRSAHDGKAIPQTIKWRPSRTLRGLLAIDRDQAVEGFQHAASILRGLPPRRKNLEFDVPLAMIAGLSGPWTFDGPLDYRIARLPASFSLQASRDRSDEQRVILQAKSWKNPAAAMLSELMARSRIPTICFILTSRHHAFSSADGVSGNLPGIVDNELEAFTLVTAWLALSDAELGVETILHDLFRRGVTVHTSAMLQTEQSASEWMFSHQKALLMFATGTLAQGLNLPAIAVVIAGTSMGDPRELRDIDSSYGISRSEALILNGFGRAGRPGFSNQGIAVLVGDEPLYYSIGPDIDPADAAARYDVMRESDAAISVHSPVEQFLDLMVAGEVLTDQATDSTLALTALLAEYTEDKLNAGQILSRTLAAYHKRQVLTSAAIDQARLYVDSTKKRFLQLDDTPAWINRAAMKSGVSFFRALRMWSAYQRRGMVNIGDGQNFQVDEWLDVFFEAMSFMPPFRVFMYLADEQLKKVTVLSKFRDAVRTQMTADASDWKIPDDWTGLWAELKTLVLMFMRGATYAEIARLYLGLTQDEEITNKRNKGDHPIPAVFGFLRKVVDQFAIDAGCFLAIQEFSVYGEGGTNAPIPEPLQALALCIRNGCDTLDVLAWYRFGFRNRVCAHTFARTFPLPADVVTDSGRAKWIRKTRGKWLTGEIVSENEPILAYAKTIMIEGAKV
jgi:hypothetical protein